VAEIFARFIFEDDMHSSSDIPTSADSQTETSFIVNLAAIVCGLVLVVAACLASSGLDLSPGLF
jgi:hypothetical protein